MAVRSQESNSTASSRPSWLVLVSLVVLVAAALFLRAYWNLDAANPSEGKFILSGGSDPYYHKRAIDAIQENGYKTLFEDPMLNYPYGAINPNPPLYEWSVAVAGLFMAPFFAGGLAEATWQATIWSPAIYGALSTIPVYFIGKGLFSRRVGLVAATLWVLSTSAIDATGLGDADHDAAIMFYATLAFAFYVQAITRFRGDSHWVANWKDGSSVAAGLGRFFRERRVALGYSVLTGFALAGVALIWKGFPYFIGILFLYAGLQMVIDHWRSRDSTGLWLGTLIAMGLGLVLALPYYNAAGLGNFLTATWYMLGAFLVAGLVLVPTRDLPTILVMPLVGVMALVGAVVAFFVVPDVARSLLYATVYFKRTALYETIAESHPADFSTITFGIGPFAFLPGVIAWFWLLFHLKDHPGRPMLFALIWGGVALFMANSAVRFLFNAIPVFCVFGAFAIVKVVEWLDFGAIKRAVQGGHGLRRGVRPMHIVGAILLAVLLVGPNVFLAADAALPPEAEAGIRDRSESAFVDDFVANRLGAYGQGFIPGYWDDGLLWLDQWDAHEPDIAKRPAFLSWWDYGHWAIAVGRHPAVADNFQNGYEFAAAFLLAQNESHAIQLLAQRHFALFGKASDPVAFHDQVKTAVLPMLTEAGSSDAEADFLAMHGCPKGAAACKDAGREPWEFAKGLDTPEKASKFLALVEGKSGKKIRYFATDIRMMPYDDPNTPNIEQSSIYYAPVRLANKDPADYVELRIVMTCFDPLTGQTRDTCSQEEYERLASDPIRTPQASGERLDYKEPFFDSMYYRGFVGTPIQGPFPTNGQTVAQVLNNPRPAFGLEHFRLVYASEALRIVQYYPGALIEGTVTEDGVPVEGATITVYDDAGKLLAESVGAVVDDPGIFNIPHGTTTTDAAGRYTIKAPFSMHNGTTLIVSRGTNEVHREVVNVSRDAAESSLKVPLDIKVRPGAVEGLVFDDKNRNGVFDAANDTIVASVNVTIGGKTATTGADGKYRLEKVGVGSQTVTVESPDHQVASTSRTVVVRSGETTTHNVSLDPRAGVLTGRLFADTDGDGTLGANETTAAQTELTFAPDASVEGNRAIQARTATQADGTYNVTLAPGTYLVSASYSGGDAQYALSDVKVVVEVGERSTRDLAMRKSG